MSAVAAVAVAAAAAAAAAEFVVDDAAHVDLAVDGVAATVLEVLLPGCLDGGSCRALY